MYIVFFRLCLCLCLWQRIWVESGIKTILGYIHTLLLASFLEAHPPFAENLAQLYFKCFFKYNIWRSFTVGTFVFHCLGNKTHCYLLLYSCWETCISSLFSLLSKERWSEGKCHTELENVPPTEPQQLGAETQEGWERKVQRHKTAAERITLLARLSTVWIGDWWELWKKAIFLNIGIIIMQLKNQVLH